MKIYFVTLLFCASSLQAAESPSGRVPVGSIEALGVGCPAGSWTSNFTADNQRLSFELDDLTAIFGPAETPAASRRTCRLKVNLQPESGWQYSVRNIHSVGYMQLDAGVLATHKITYFFEGQKKQEVSNVTQVGPYEAGYSFNSAGDPAARVWSACENHQPLLLYISTILRAASSSTSKNAQGRIDNDSLNFGLVYDFDLEWRRCPAEGN